MTPMISNTGETRFLFGTFVDADSAPVFRGAVIYGSDFTYDAKTTLPTGGTVERIAVQTRSAVAVAVITTHATYPDINSPVADLNTAFADADTPWFDATDVLSSGVQDDSAPLDLYVVLDDAQMGELTSGKTELHLETGEFFSAHELSGIFASNNAKVTPKPPARGKKRNERNKARTADVLVMLNATFENAATSNFNDLDIEALENDLRVGAL